jgi:hypothetical protein
MGYNQARLNRVVCALLLTSSLLAASAFAQDPLPLTVSPGKLAMLVGDTHTFRAVGKDGRMRHNVRWSISPEHAATLTPYGDEAMVQARQISSSILLTAYAEGDSAEATIEIKGGSSLPLGSVIWSVAEMPGCKDKKIIPAVPSAAGPDIYVQEDCPTGMWVRAITADGRELWRRNLGGPGAVIPPEVSAKMESSEHLNLHAKSVCDAVTSGMSKEEVSRLIASRNLSFEERQQQSDSWALEEEGFRCTISFDGKPAAVVKKKKTIVTD